MKKVILTVALFFGMSVAFAETSGIAKGGENPLHSGLVISQDGESVFVQDMESGQIYETKNPGAQVVVRSGDQVVFLMIDYPDQSQWQAMLLYKEKGGAIVRGHIPN